MLSSDRLSMCPHTNAAIRDYIEQMRHSYGSQDGRRWPEATRLNGERSGRPRSAGPSSTPAESHGAKHDAEGHRTLLASGMCIATPLRFYTGYGRRHGIARSSARHRSGNMPMLSHADRKKHCHGDMRPSINHNSARQTQHEAHRPSGLSGGSDWGARCHGRHIFRREPDTECSATPTSRQISESDIASREYV